MRFLIIRFWRTFSTVKFRHKYNVLQILFFSILGKETLLISENFKSVFKKNFFQHKEIFFKNFDFNKRFINEIWDNNENADDSAIQFPTKSILRPMILTETTRQRGS